MFFRFAATLVILTGLSVFGMSLEKQNLKLKRVVSLQHDDLHALEEDRSRLFLKTQQLGAPPRLIRDWESHESLFVESNRPKLNQLNKKSAEAPPPLLEWRMRLDAPREK